MKELILIRHAKSDWTNESIKDIDRPLNERGYYDAYSLSEWFKEEMPLPDLIVSSPATRALNTAFIFCRTLSIREDSVRIIKSLYESTSKDYLKVISSIENEYNRIIIFGHNPAITNLTNELNNDLIFENIPTCGIVKIGFDNKSWTEVAKSKGGKLLMNKFPKSFK